MQKGIQAGLSICFFSLFLQSKSLWSEVYRPLINYMSHQRISVLEGVLPVSFICIITKKEVHLNASKAFFVNSIRHATSCVNIL